jgi:hypothetical protein
MESLPCWPCYRDGFEEPNQNLGGRRISRTQSTEDKQCPKCGVSLDYGAFLDTVTGQRGWAYDECNIVYSSLEV